MTMQTAKNNSINKLVINFMSMRGQVYKVAVQTNKNYRNREGILMHQARASRQHPEPINNKLTNQI